MTVEPVQVTPEPMEAALPLIFAVAQASVQPVPQVIPVNYGGPVVAVATSHARQNVGVTIAVPLEAVAVTGQGRDISLQESIGGRLQVDTVQVSPALFEVAMYGEGVTIMSVDVLEMAPALPAVALVFGPTTLPDEIVFSGGPHRVAWSGGPDCIAFTGRSHRIKWA
jgi:hypothetical protein